MLANYTYHLEFEGNSIFVLNNFTKEVFLKSDWKETSKIFSNKNRELLVFDDSNSLYATLIFTYPKNFFHFSWNETVEIYLQSSQEKAILKCVSKLNNTWLVKMENIEFTYQMDSLFKSNAILVNKKNYCEIIPYTEIAIHRSVDESLKKLLLLVFMIGYILNPPTEML